MKKKLIACYLIIFSTFLSFKCFSDSGSLEIIVGPMCSGKSEELIRRLNLVRHAKQKVEIFTHEICHNPDKDLIISRSGKKIEGKRVSTTQVFSILNNVDKKTEVVAIDEAHFFDENLIDVVEELVRRGKRVILSGLDTDFKGKPFNSIPKIIAMANSVTKLKAICSECKKEAVMTQRFVNGVPASENDPLVVSVNHENVLYKPACRNCHKIGGVTAAGKIPGSLTVIFGPMCSGKSEELIKQVRLVFYKGKKSIAFTNQVANDQVDENGVIFSRSGLSEKAIKVKNENVLEIVEKSQDFDVVAIEEAQFFNKDIIDVVVKLVYLGKDVFVSGLNTDTQEKPFGPMPELLAIADSVTKLSSFCVECKKPANISQLVLNDEPVIPKNELKILDKDDRKACKVTFRPVCKDCFLKCRVRVIDF